jgi:pyruvate/2-oxoglutarate dehydrogenase complex dihydrolipoamide acyltransferase (E2) component
VAGELIGLTLGCDHRILFGAQADAFLENLSQRLERVQL